MFGSTQQSNSRTFDRLIGIFVTIGVVLSIGAATKFVKKQYATHKKEEERKSRKGDENYQTRWKNSSGHLVTHIGTCHCERIRFRILANPIIYAVDIPSKVRFPRLTIPVDNFEPLTDESMMSLYAVKTVDKGVGIHTFCSYCGVHVIYAPDTDPTEIQVNADCLDKRTVEKIFVSYLATNESTPVPVSYEAARPFNRRGTGAYARHSTPPQSKQKPGHDNSNSGSWKSMYMIEADQYPRDAGEHSITPQKTNSDPWGTMDWSGGTGGTGGTGEIGGSGIKRVSPFSKNKQLQTMRTRYVEDACSSYLDAYYTAGVSGPYGGYNAQGQYDNPMYTQQPQQEAESSQTPQWNRYYSSSSNVNFLPQKEMIDGDIDVDACIEDNPPSGTSLMSLVPSPMKLRSFAETTNAARGFSPSTFTKQLDSMKQHLSHYPQSGDDRVNI